MSADDISKAFFRIAEYVYKVWKKIPRIEIMSQETTINVPETVVEYTIAVKIPTNFRSIRKPIEFKSRSIIRISAVSLHPLFRTVREAVRRYENANGDVSFVLFPELLPSDTDSISLSVSYNIDDPFLVDGLVDRQKAHEPSGADKNEYWMSAQLKHPKILKQDFGRFDLRDVDVTVDVGVHNELKTTIPPAFIARLRTFFAIMAESDPRRQYLAVPKLRQLAKEKTAGKEFEILSELESLFLPMTFCKYVDVKEDFHYSDCYKSKECFELPIDVIPKRMNVISRADLTLDKPTAKGILFYNNNLFMDAIKKILSEK
jgi:hypothetical protein